MKRRNLLQTALHTAVMLPAGGAGALYAQSSPNQAAGDWPQRPVKWILSQPAAAGPDVVARYLGEQLTKLWGQSVVVDNRPGGQNVIGAQAAARSQADGYNFYYATTAAMVTNAFTFKTLPYDPVKDFAPVRLIGRSAFVIAAAPNFAVKDLAEAISQAKAQPNKIAIATEGTKTFAGMLADTVAAMAGIKLTHVPYTKTTDAIQDVLAGRVQLICMPDAALVPFLKSGQMKALAVSTGQRLSTLPGVPTLSETFAKFEFTGWHGLYAPTGTPPAILNKVHRDIESILKQPEVVQRLLTLGLIAETNMSIAAFEGFMRSERDRWASIVKSIGIVAE